MPSSRKVNVPANINLSVNSVIINVVVVDMDNHHFSDITDISIKCYKTKF